MSNDVFVYFWEQVTAHNWKYVAILAVIGIVALIRQFGGSMKWLAWTKSDLGGFVVSSLTNMSAAIINALLAHQPIVAGFSHGVAMSLMTAGGYVGSKHVVKAVRAMRKPAPAPAPETKEGQP